jgi:hypothetical protein
VNRLQRTNLRLTVQGQSQSRNLERARDAGLKARRIIAWLGINV